MPCISWIHGVLEVFILYCIVLYHKLSVNPDIGHNNYYYIFLWWKKCDINFAFQKRGLVLQHQIHASKHVYYVAIWSQNVRPCWMLSYLNLIVVDIPLFYTSCMQSAYIHAAIVSFASLYVNNSLRKY